MRTRLPEALKSGQQVPKVARGTVVALTAVAALVGMITGAAQHLAETAARAGDYPPYLYSPPKHVLAMVLLAGLGMLLATALSLRAGPWLGGAVVLATALGPMTIVAAPVGAGLVAFSNSDTVLWWHLVVAAPIALVLGAGTWWNTRCLRGHTLKSRTPTASRPDASLASPMSIFAVVTMTAVMVQILFGYAENVQAPGLLPITGWAVLAGAMAAVTIRPDGWKLSAVLTASTGIVLMVMYLAYHRPSGWPGVAGWEFNGMQSPIVLSPTATILLLAAASGGLIWRASVVLLTRTQPRMASEAFRYPA